MERQPLIRNLAARFNPEGTPIRRKSTRLSQEGRSQLTDIWTPIKDSLADGTISESTAIDLARSKVMELKDHSNLSSADWRKFESLAHKSIEMRVRNLHTAKLKEEVSSDFSPWKSVISTLQSSLYPRFREKKNAFFENFAVPALVKVKRDIEQKARKYAEDNSIVSDWQIYAQAAEEKVARTTREYLAKMADLSEEDKRALKKGGLAKVIDTAINSKYPFKRFKDLFYQNSFKTASQARQTLPLVTAVDIEAVANETTLVTAAPVIITNAGVERVTSSRTIFNWNRLKDTARKVVQKRPHLGRRFKDLIDAYYYQNRKRLQIERADLAIYAIAGILAGIGLAGPVKEVQAQNQNQAKSEGNGTRIVLVDSSASNQDHTAVVFFPPGESDLFKGIQGPAFFLAATPESSGQIQLSDKNLILAPEGSIFDVGGDEKPEQLIPEKGAFTLGPIDLKENFELVSADFDTKQTVESVPVLGIGFNDKMKQQFNWRTNPDAVFIYETDIPGNYILGGDSSPTRQGEDQLIFEWVRQVVQKCLDDPQACTGKSITIRHPVDNRKFVILRVIGAMEVDAETYNSAVAHYGKKSGMPDINRDFFRTDILGFPDVARQPGVVSFVTCTGLDNGEFSRRAILITEMQNLDFPTMNLQ